MHLRKSRIAFAAVMVCFGLGATITVHADRTTVDGQPQQPLEETALSDQPPPLQPQAEDAEPVEKVITIHLGPEGKPIWRDKIVEQPAKGAPAAPATAAKGSQESKVASALENRRARLAKEALTYRGTPYVWGGTSTRGFDCSGFTQYLYRQQGVKIPRTAKEQFKAGSPVPKNQLISGDLVFFNTTGPITHVGMYIGDRKFVHAANPRRGVRVDTLTSGHYANRYAGARRYK